VTSPLLELHFTLLSAVSIQMHSPVQKRTNLHFQPHHQTADESDTYSNRFQPSRKKCGDILAEIMVMLVKMKDQYVCIFFFQYIKTSIEPLQT